MWLKKKKQRGSSLQEWSDIINPKEKPQAERNEDTAARVKAVLSQLQAKDYIVLAKAESDSSDKIYEIRMGKNHAVFCTCKGWQYSKTGTCKHLERFKSQVKPFVVKSE